MRKLFLCASALVLMTACEKPAYNAGSEADLVAYAPAAENTENYASNPVAPAMRVAETPVSTFAVDVDTASYANARRMLRQGQMPSPDAVRTEEMLNYFRYDYARPTDRSQPFSITTDVSTTPWNPNSRILRIGLRAWDVASNERPAANLVFLIDVSGSMDDADKLPLVKHALSLLADRMRHDDRVSIVVYAGAAGLVLPATSDPGEVRSALNRLQAGGSTAGGQGLELAYAVARDNFIDGGVNRVILATDGDFNVGVSDVKGIQTLVEHNRDNGITLTTLGFGEGNLNDAMMEKIADVGNGNYAYIDQPEEARKVLDDELSATLVTVAKDVKIQVEFNPAQVSQYRLIGYENRALKEDDFDNDHVDAGDMGAGHQVTAIYEIVLAGGKGWLPDRHFAGNTPASVTTGGDDAIFLKLRYKLPDGKESRLIEKTVSAAALRQAAAPAGDLAFAESVAAYGQILRHDTYMSGFSLADVRDLAGHPDGYLRNEFVELTRMAEGARPRN